jgi:hypothetical protein
VREISDDLVTSGDDSRSLNSEVRHRFDCSRRASFANKE